MKSKILPTVMLASTLTLSITLIFSSYLSGDISVPGEKPISITAINASVGPPITVSKSYFPTPADTFFILVIGNDYRPGVGGKRADAIHLVGVNTKEKRASIINFPRDTNVAIPGHGKNKINAANAYGGSALTTQTVSELVGVSISYVMEVDFAGFTGLVDDLGGLDVPVEKPMHDKNSGTNFNPGVMHMNGSQALAFARDRYSFSNGDISRTHNQGILLVSALRQMLTNKNEIPSKFESASFIAKNVALTNITVRDIYLLMELAKSVIPDHVSNVTVPWSGSNTLAPSANDLFADFKDNAIIDTYGR